MFYGGAGLVMIPMRMCHKRGAETLRKLKNFVINFGNVLDTGREKRFAFEILLPIMGTVNYNFLYEHYTNIQ